jgi:hypothetical protein
MSKRQRLTQRRKQAVDGSIPYPGNVNQPDRQFKDADQYDNYTETINHPIPDMRHDWQDDERDEIGFGIPEPWGVSPTVASVRVAANKAVKLAYFLLGDKVAESIIEDQAHDLMLLGPEALDRSLARFSATGELYAEDKEDDSEDDAKEASAKVAEDEDEDDSEDDAKEASAKVAEDHEDEDEDEDDSEDDAKEASNSLDIELSPVVADDEVDISNDARLAGLFDDDIPTELPEPGAGREASGKKGVKSLGGGQPRVAGNSDANDISSIWNDSPDVSDIFN